MNKISGFTEDFRLHSAQWTFISCMIMFFLFSDTFKSRYCHGKCHKETLEPFEVFF